MDKKKAICKGFVTFFNISFVVYAFGAIAVGIWLLFTGALFDRFHGINKLLYPCAILIAAGILLLLATSSGFYSIAYEHKCMLRTFIAFTLIVAVAKLGAGGLAFEYRLSVKSAISRETATVIRETYGTGDRQTDNDVNLLQEKLKCCGATSFRDYVNSTWIKAFDANIKYVPESCCSVPALCTRRTNSSLLYLSGCSEKLYASSDLYLVVLGGVAVAMGGVEFIGVCVAFYLSSILGTVHL